MGRKNPKDAHATRGSDDGGGGGGGGANGGVKRVWRQKWGGVVKMWPGDSTAEP